MTLENTLYVVAIVALLWYMRELIFRVMVIIGTAFITVLIAIVSIPFMAIWAGLRLFGKI